MAARERERAAAHPDDGWRAMHVEAARAYEKWANEMERIAEAGDSLDATHQTMLARFPPREPGGPDANDQG